MDHVARLAIHEEANVRTCWRLCIGFLRKHCRLHMSLPKFHRHVQGTRANERLTHEGMMTHSHAQSPVTLQTRPNPKLPAGAGGSLRGFDSRRLQALQFLQRAMTSDHEARPGSLR